MKLEKQKPGRSKKYTEFIRRQACCLTGMEDNENQSVDPHHEPEPGHGTMGGKPCDSRCVPVAHFLHCEMEDLNGGRKKVWCRFGVDPEEVIEAMKRRWIKAGGKAFWDE